MAVTVTVNVCCEPLPLLICVGDLKRNHNERVVLLRLDTLSPFWFPLEKLPEAAIFWLAVLLSKQSVAAKSEPSLAGALEFNFAHRLNASAPEDRLAELLFQLVPPVAI